MSNENIVSIQLPEKDLQKVLESLKTINEVLSPYLLALTPQERQNLPKMSDKTFPFVEKSLEYCKSNPEFAPAYMNIEELSIDLKAVEDLTQIYRIVEQLSEGLNDTIMLSGSEAYTSALTYYNSIKQATKINVPKAKAIFEDLKKRFEGQGKKEK